MFSSAQILAAEDRLLGRAADPNAPAVDIELVERITSREVDGQHLSTEQAEALARIAVSGRQVDLLIGQRFPRLPAVEGVALQASGFGAPSWGQEDSRCRRCAMPRTSRCDEVGAKSHLGHSRPKNSRPAAVLTHCS